MLQLIATAAARVISDGAGTAILSGRAHVELNFAPPVLVTHLREDADAFAAAGLFCAAGSGGRKAEADHMRSAESCDPIDRDRNLGRWTAFFAMWERLDLVRQELEAELGLSLLPEMEISYVRYPVGGFYQRHVDDTHTDDSSDTTRRAVSFVCFLPDDDWQASDGGLLRIFGEHACQDLIPQAGALVLFDSCQVEHEVLPTRRERLVLVGWWHTPRGEHGVVDA